jgi:hypothetical protein
MNLFVLWTESYGEALKTANQLAEQGGHILDCSIIGKWSQVLVHFGDVKAEKIVSELRITSQHKKTWLPEIKKQTVESYLSLSTQKIEEFLITVETPFIGDIFELLQAVNTDQYPIVDLRLLRFNEPKSLMLLTGAAKEADQLLVIIENFKARGKTNLQVEIIKSVAPPIKELFHYSEKI